VAIHQHQTKILPISFHIPGKDQATHPSGRDLSSSNPIFLEILKQGSSGSVFPNINPKTNEKNLTPFILLNNSVVFKILITELERSQCHLYACSPSKKFLTTMTTSGSKRLEFNSTLVGKDKAISASELMKRLKVRRFKYKIMCKIKVFF
jgi:hypothetical protein